MTVSPTDSLNSPLYVIAIGGSGAKCAEAIVHIAAAGLFPETKITILFVDPDEGNGNVTRTRQAIDLYRECRQLVTQKNTNPVPWLQTEIVTFDVWSPFQGTNVQTLEAFFQYNTCKSRAPHLASLLDVLYTQAEREAKLDVGFRGRPAIGSAILSQIDFKNQYPWKPLLDQIREEADGREPKIFLCGSIFGGTGASGFPTIAQLIASELGGKRSKVKIGGGLLLPYFTFSEPFGQDVKEVYARPDEFLLKTQAALYYYTAQVQDEFDAIYLLGDNQSSPVGRFSIGRSDQCNEPHLTELYVALLARDFLLHPPTEENQRKKEQVILATRDGAEGITWADIPLPEDDRKLIRKCLAQTTRFAFAWTADLFPELQRATKVGVKPFQKEAPWFRRFFRPEQGFIGKLILGEYKEFPEFKQAQQQAAGKFEEWCRRYLGWMASLHYSYSSTAIDKIQLFKPNFWADRDGRLNPQREQFFQLLVALSDRTAESDEEEDDRQASVKDTIARLKERLDSPQSSENNDKGSVGLAKTLYTLCQDKS